MKRTTLLLALVAMASSSASGTTSIGGSRAWAQTKTASPTSEAPKTSGDIQDTPKAPNNASNTAQQSPMEQTVRVGRFGTIHVYINPHMTTTISTDKPIARDSTPPWKELNYDRDLCHITLRPKMLPTGDVLGSMELTTTESVITVVLHAGKSPGQAHSHFRAEFDAQPTPNNLCADRQTRTMPPQLALASFQGQVPGSAVLDISDVLFNQETFKIERQGNVESQDLAILNATLWARINTQWYLLFEVENGDPRKFPVGKVHLENEYGFGEYARAVYVEPGRIDPTDNTITTVPPGHRLQMAVLISDPRSLGDHVTLAVSEPDGNRRIQRNEIPVWDLTPPPDDNVGKITVSLRATAGAAWLGDGLGADRQDAAFLSGAGVQVTYGLTKLLNLEAEIAGARSRNARFDSMTFEDMDGELLRRVDVARIQFGGLLRLGRTYMPHVRIGLGLQMASYDTEFIIGNTSRPGPDSSLEFTTYLNLGGGLDIRIRDRWMAGIALSVVEPREADLLNRTIQASFHLSYHWKP